MSLRLALPLLVLAVSCSTPTASTESSTSMNLSPHSTPEKPFGDGYGGTYSFILGDNFDSAAAARAHMESKEWVAADMADLDVPQFGERLALPERIAVVYHAEDDQRWVVMEEHDGWTVERLAWRLAQATAGKMEDVGHVFVEQIIPYVGPDDPWSEAWKEDFESLVSSSPAAAEEHARGTLFLFLSCGS